ncbi:hypothetical protein QQG55_41890 [Brugia pahangi]
MDLGHKEHDHFTSLSIADKPSSFLHSAYFSHDTWLRVANCTDFSFILENGSGERRMQCKGDVNKRYTAL